MRVLGRFGDTHVTPVGLGGSVRPASAPAGTIDVQFRVPVSLSLLLEALSAGGRGGDVAAWAAGYRDLVAGLAVSVQRAGGYALVDGDIAVPARLEVATAIEDTVAGLGIRWHGHVWVGPTATTIAEGERHPVALDVMARKVQNVAWPTYMRDLEQLAQREFGVRWDEPRPRAVREIVEPPWHEHIGAAERGLCPGPWGPLGAVVQADEEELRIHVEMERSHRVAVEQGTVYRPPGLEDDPAEVRDTQWEGLLGAGAATGRAFGPDR